MVALPSRIGAGNFPSATYFQNVDLPSGTIRKQSSIRNNRSSITFINLLQHNVGGTELYNSYPPTLPFSEGFVNKIGEGSGSPAAFGLVLRTARIEWA
jgi:hypothetical protein